MSGLGRSFSTRLAVALGVLLLVYAGLVSLIQRQVQRENELESLQRVSHGLAQHIVEHWPQIALADSSAADGAADGAARAALLRMLMVVNPGVQVYVLNADGAVAHYIGEPGMVRQAQVDLQPVRAFLAGANLPLAGTDPMAPPGAAAQRVFSAAMFAPRAGDSRPPGYLYIVLDGGARAQVAGQLSPWRGWRGAGLVGLVALLATLAAGTFALRRLTLPLRRLAGTMRQQGQHAEISTALPGPITTTKHVPGDEVQVIETAYAEMTQRLQAQQQREREQTLDHREMMASVAHDLRTPLTALHGHLEALADNGAPLSQRQERVLAVALSQSDKVRRLSQQLFELAALNSSDQVLQRERFSLDELVSDAVQKFELGTQSPRVVLDGTAPGRLELEADLQLVERALSNLIDNAVRHAPGAEPVRVSLRREGTQAQIWVEDSGPGLPSDLLQRLHSGLSVRDPPPRRATTKTNGGIGGLGLAIAQRVAQLHGGSLRPLPSPLGGTRLCLMLPMQA